MKEEKRTSISADRSTVDQLRKLAYLVSNEKGERVSQQSIVKDLIREALDAKTEEEKDQIKKEE